MKSKLPRSVITRLEEYKNDDDQPWQLETLRKDLRKFITAQEAGERQTNFNNKSFGDEKHLAPPPPPPAKRHFNNRFATGALIAGVRARKCIYCDAEHWNDECKAYADVTSRKKRLIGQC